MNTYDGVWDVISAYAPYFYLVLVVVTLMAALNAVAMVLEDRFEGTFAVSMVVFGILGLTGLGLAIVLWQCKRRSQ
ncbi:hypothetical protein [Natrinema longum]|uniref:Uncharacterized protein n=1 Tax=Natrinema longum TaxID=370324 RepID=A0A8A2UFT2_9EURY|nr:hypothetical protein [Natrinema longum]MBZ6495276.1 hypothetical protein [Natrinema longum]QSW86745.1 hypothetical protein J0X27_08020 [Natrinema longum]